MPKENRVCTLCFTYEDEIHVIKECPKFDGLRDRYLSFMYSDCQHMNEPQTIKHLLNNDSKRKLDNVTIFIRKSMQRHSEFAQQYMEIEEMIYYADNEDEELNNELNLI